MFVAVQSLSCGQLFENPKIAACQASLSFTISWSLLKVMSFKLMMPSNHLILYHPLLRLCLAFPSIRVSLVISSFFLESFVHSSPVAYWAPTHLRSSSVKYKDEISMWRNKHSQGEGCSERLLSITESCLSYPSKQSYFFFPQSQIPLLHVSEKTVHVLWYHLCEDRCINVYENRQGDLWKFSEKTVTSDTTCSEETGFFFATPSCSVWDLSSPFRDWTRAQPGHSGSMES